MSNRENGLIFTPNRALCKQAASKIHRTIDAKDFNEAIGLGVETYTVTHRKGGPAPTALNLVQCPANPVHFHMRKLENGKYEIYIAPLWSFNVIFVVKVDLIFRKLFNSVLVLPSIKCHSHFAQLYITM